MPTTTPPQTPAVSGPAAPRSPHALDSVTVTAHKVCVGQDCTIELVWTGASGPVTVVTATEPTFQQGVETLEMGTTMVHRTIDPFPAGDYFIDIADATLAGRATQGIGYDPIPLPRIDSMTGGNWWWDPTDPSSGEIVVHGAYLDPIAEANVAILPNRAVRASSVDPSGSDGFSSSATFQIPSDARGNYVRLVSGGRTARLVAPGGLFLHPRGIPAYGSIRGVVWAPTTGKLWVAADSVIDEIDLFLRQPVQTTTVTGLTKPYISRVSDTHELVLVDGVSGVTEVKVIDTTTGLVTSFATARDSHFTRQIRPVGIALDRDGTACYIADAYAAGGRVVKIPRSNNADITDDYGGYTSWAFPDPCGMEMAESGTLLIPDATAVRKVNPGGTSTEVVWGNISRKTVLIDREASDMNTDRVFLSGNPGFAECFNADPIEYGSGTTTSPARNLAGLVYGWTNGLLSLESHWFYEVVPKGPQKVLLHNALQGDWPYPSPNQTVDRVVKITVEGWEGVPLHLELTDPPDLAPYIARDLDDPAGFTAFPYDAGDNVGEVAGEYGLTLNPDGSSPTMTLIVTPGADDLATFYLKVPPNVSGNNYQVKVSKVDQTTDLPLTNRVVSLSPFYTTWKRIYVERDKMFRKGGVLSRNYGAPGVCGGPEEPPCCGTGGELPCDQIEVFDWHNVELNDWIMIFDESWYGDIRKVTSVGPPQANGLAVLTLDLPLEHSYYASDSDSVSGGDLQPVFSNNHSAGFGTIYSCDLDPNQINQPNSCFFEGDLRGVERAFADSYVEIFGPRSGISVLPYLPEAWFNWEEVYEPPPDTNDPTDLFSWVWNYHRTENADNWRHLLGASSSTFGFTVGMTKRAFHYTFVFREAIEDDGADQIPPKTEAEVHNHTQSTTNHELGHHFSLQPCDLVPPENPGHHDDEVNPKNAWCEESGDCGPNAQDPELCMMNTGDILSDNGQGWDPVMRFCDQCILLGDPDCPDPPAGEGRAGAIRTEEDPLP
jgi:DNA-binding beta-propeller fold protein YncE